MNFLSKAGVPCVGSSYYLKRNPVTVARQTDYVFKQSWVKVIFSRMRPIGQILNFDNQREFENRGTEHMHAWLHMVDAPKIYKNEDSEVVKFIDNGITCALPDETKYSEMSNLVKKCRLTIIQPLEERSLTCIFNAPWALSDKSRVVRFEEQIDETTVKQSKKLIEKELVVTISDLSGLTLSEIFEECRVTAEKHDNTGFTEKKVFVLYKRKPFEVNIGPCPVNLKLLKSNINLHFVTGVYAVLTYLTSSFCKPEHAKSSLMKMTKKGLWKRY